jgi:hypothetical protein
VSDNRRVDIPTKLQLRPGQSVFVGGAPQDLALGLANEAPDLDGADAVIVFCPDSDALDRWREQLETAVARDALVWVAYPKAGKLGTDLNRDRLWQLVQNEGIRPVRQIAIDDVWSALRFRSV